MARLLVVDDESSIVWAVTQIAERLGHHVKSAATAEKGIEIAVDFQPELIVLDVRLPGMDGLTAMRQLLEIAPQTPIIVITAFGDLGTAVQAIQQGAFEYLIKPFDMATIESTLSRALSNRPSTIEAQSPTSVAGLVGSSHKMQETFKQIALAAASDAAVMITGESGTGKELAARAVHENSSRAGGPFVVVNLASLSPSLAESELFGHVKGAFTDAQQAREGFLVQADQGTLFLDEVAEIPLTLQVKLLRSLESGEVIPVGSNQPIHSSFRIITATHQSLEARTQAGEFRHDLFFRLSAFQIMMPPLREREGDIRLLAQHFLEQISQREGRPTAQLSPAALAVLEESPWAGNVREFRNALEHAVIVSRGQLIDVNHLPAPASWTTGRQESNDLPSRMTEAITAWARSEISASTPTDLYNRFLTLAEPAVFAPALNASHGQFVAASRLLGIHRTTLRKKADEYGLDPIPDDDAP